MKTFLNIALLSICVLAYAANAAIERRAEERRAEPVAPPAPWVAPAEPIIAPSRCSPYCTCGDDCRCSGAWVCYGTGRAKAEAERRPMLVFVTAKDCPPCRALESTLATMDLSSHVCVKVESSPELPNPFGLDRFPALIVSGPGPALEWRSTTPGAISADVIRGLLIQPTATPAVQVAPRPAFAPVRGFFSRSGC